MTIEERAELAAELKKSGKYNCTQSVVKVFENELPVEPDTLLQLTAGFAAGMGCMESTCGALTGGTGTPRIAKQLLQAFQQTSGATICKDLKGVQTGTPLCSCPDCVRNAVLALGSVLPH